MEFKAEATLIEAITSENIKNIRNALIEYIRRDPGNVEDILGALNYTHEFVDEIFEPGDEKLLKGIECWNKEYFLNLIEDLAENFSEERFNHTCLVGSFIYPKVENNDAIVINNTEPVSDIEIQIEKLKTGIALGVGIVAGFLIGRKLRR